MKLARPIVAVSACLLGEKVRYDGDDKLNETVVGLLAEHFDYLPFCPEVGIGLPVPRPPMHLVREKDGVQVLGVADRAIDVTEPLYAYGQEKANELVGVSGIIFKSRSPSCGLGSTPLHDRNGAVINHTSGAFSAVIAAALPELAMVEEDGLADPEGLERFIHDVFLCHGAGS